MTVPGTFPEPVPELSQTCQKIFRKTARNIFLLQNIGEQTGEIATNISLFQIQYHIIIYVVDYLHFKRKNFFGTEESLHIEVDYLVNNILTILKKGN